jgi:hypothetical protein
MQVLGNPFAKAEILSEKLIGEGNHDDMATTDLFALLPVELHLKIIKHLTFHGLFWARGINKFYLTECLHQIRSKYIEYVVPRITPFGSSTWVSSSWMQLQRPKQKGPDDLYLWKRSSTYQDPSFEGFGGLRFYLYPLLNEEFEIFNNRFRFGEDEQSYLISPRLAVNRKTDPEDSKCEWHWPFASFSREGEELSWSGNEESGYTVVFEEEEDWALAGGRGTTCKCIQWKVKEGRGVRKTASWEIEIPLFALYRHLQKVRPREGFIELAWWVPQAKDREAMAIDFPYSKYG